MSWKGPRPLQKYYLKWKHLKTKQNSNTWTGKNTNTLLMKSNRLVYFQHSLLRSANTHPYTRFLTPIKSTEVSKIKNKPAFKTRVWAYGEVLTVSYCKASSIHQPLFFPWHLFLGLLDKNRKQKYTHYESAKVFECNSIFPKGKQRPC